MWNDFWRGVTEGCFSVASRKLQTLASSNGHAHGRIDDLCDELGWEVDERDGNTVRLHFSGKSSGKRKVSVINGDETFVTFMCHSKAYIPAAKVPPEIMAYLLCRNLEESGLGNWAMSCDDGNVLFSLMYQPPGEGLNAGMFKDICESLVNEVADFDSKMEAANLLH